MALHLADFFKTCDFFLHATIYHSPCKYFNKKHTKSVDFAIPVRISGSGNFRGDVQNGKRKKGKQFKICIPFLCESPCLDTEGRVAPRNYVVAKLFIHSCRGPFAPPYKIKYPLSFVKFFINEWRIYNWKIQKKCMRNNIFYVFAYTK